MITITLDKQQSRVLLDMIHVAEWVYNAHKPYDEGNKEVEQCVGHINRQLYDQGFKSDFDLDHNNEISIRQERLDECIDIVNEYTKDRFWDHLAEYLAERDLREQFSETELRNMDNETLFDHQLKIQDRYFEEFETHGIDNLIIGSSLPGFLKDS